METPLVTVICLCYNHSRFVQEAIGSVLNQSYPNIQLIVVDDASTDNSVEVIRELIRKYPTIEFLPIQTNIGNCKAFNRGFTKAKGEYVIDLAADDMLSLDRVEIGVKELQLAGKDYGVHFSDAELISENGQHLSLHSGRFPHDSIPRGDIYKELINRYFICPPSLICSGEVMNYVGGYDETLTYEDFDFLIRSSRKFKYVYSPKVLVKKRVTEQALNKQQFKLFSRHSVSTFKVCEKIRKMNKTSEEQKALSGRIFYEIKLNFRLLNFGIVVQYIFMWIRNQKLLANSH